MNNSEIILIYQLGKVGSSTIYATLKQIYGEDSVVQLHFLSEKFKKRAAGQIKYKWHIRQIEKVERLRARFPNKRIKIISLVREPVARNISDLFQNPGNYLEEGKKIDDVNAAELLKIYKKRNSYSYTLNWFDKEFMLYTGIDVYNHQFDSTDGYVIFQEKEYDVLIFQMEALNRCYKKALSVFLGQEIAHLKVTNESNSKASAKLSNELKNRIVFSKEELEEVYSSKYVQHFYGNEVKLLTEKWLKNSR